MAARKRKLSKKGKIKVALFFVKIAVVILVLFVLLKGCGALLSKNDKGACAKAFETVPERVKNSEEYIEATTKPTEKEMTEYIKANKKLYTKELINYYEDFPEALAFVYDYPEKKDVKAQIDLSKEAAGGQVPLLLQWDERWGYEKYGEDMMCFTGCGPTCMSMVYIGLTKDATKDPITMSEFCEKNGYYENGAGTVWSLFSEGAEKLGLESEELTLDENVVKEELGQGNPVILSMSGDAFSTAGQYVVLTGVEDGQFIVRDPYSAENSQKKWDWSEFGEEVANLWAFRAGSKTES